MLFDLLTMDLSTIFQEHSCCVSSEVTALCMFKPNQAKQQERTIRRNLSMTLATYSCDRSLPSDLTLPWRAGIVWTWWLSILPCSLLSSLTQGSPSSRIVKKTDQEWSGAKQKAAYMHEKPWIASFPSQSVSVCRSSIIFYEVQHEPVESCLSSKGTKCENQILLVIEMSLKITTSS